MDTHDWPADLLYAPSGWDGTDRPPRQNTLRDITREVMQAVTGFATIGPPEGVIWRGQANIAWALTSRLGRDSDGHRASPDTAAWGAQEREMIAAARTTGADGAHRMTDVEILARLRHHGARTRLIDCTEDPIVALWFACSDEMDSDTDEHDGLIVALDRQRFDELQPVWEKQYEDLARAATTGVGHFVKVPPIDPRISAQRGVFIFVPEPPSTSATPYSEVPIDRGATWVKNAQSRLEKICGGKPLADAQGKPVTNFPTLVGIVIPKVVKPWMRQTLSTTYGLSRTAMFPDFAGLGEIYGR